MQILNKYMADKIENFVEWLC